MNMRTRSSAFVPARRRGTIVPALAVTMVGLIAFLALAVDVGMMATMKTQLQHTADLAALTAARTVNGNASGNYNQTAATSNAQTVLNANYILGTKIPASQLTLTYGSYDYNQTTQTFNANFPATTGVPTTAVAATVTSNNATPGFSKIFGSQFLPNLTATAQAAHRPRDIGLVEDLSGSMRFGTLLGFDFYTNSRVSNNPDSLYPTWGQYSSNNAKLQGPTTNQTSGYDNYTISPSNTTAGNSSYTLTYVNNFYQNAAYAGTLIRAFDSYSSTNGGSSWTPPTTQMPQLPPTSYATTPGGDIPLYKSGSTTTWATDVNDVINSSSANALWELDGYSAYSAGKPDTSGTGSIPKVWLQADYSTAGTQFNGYTQGPGYYGKTFFLWPPDPRDGDLTSGATLTSMLTALGVSATDASTISSNWTTWVSQGSTGLTNLQNWMKGNSTNGGPYTTSSKFVPNTNNKAPIYYAVSRLFNEQYPAGTSNGNFTADWRQRFFGTKDDTKLFNSNGSLNTPGGSTYTINYNAILSWITQTPNPFPTQLRAGRIKYYGSIPTSITGTYPNFGSTDQRFWVEFINYALGFYQTGSSSYQDISAMAGYGSDFTWGTVSRSAPPSSGYQSITYTDNPARPNLRCWFGPMAMVDYLQNYNMYENVSNYFFMQPGDSYEAPLYTAKQAYLAAVSTMQSNHPNDWVTIAPYSWPRTSSNAGFGRFNCVSCPLGTNYNYASASLMFPFSTINADGSCNQTEVTPYDADAATGSIPSANFVDVPRGDGDTSFAMALMLCHNQFATTPLTDGTLRNFVSSSPITFPSGMAGGMGRKGAQKVIIFETDGIPNCGATATLVNSGTYSYYKIRYDMNNPSGSEFPTINVTNINDPTVLSQIYSLIQQLATSYGTTRNPFRLYSVGFGPVFQGAMASQAESTLQNMQYYAGTQSSASTPLSSNQIITGTDAQMSTAMINTFTAILQNGVQVALIK
jgi:Flp pilus assembly protein TadG